MRERVGIKQSLTIKNPCDLEEEYHQTMWGLCIDRVTKVQKTEFSHTASSEGGSPSSTMTCAL